MPWAAVSDRLHDDPDAYEAGAEGLGLWAMCRSWIAQNLTDGRIPARIARAKARAIGADPDRAIAALLRSGLWREEGGDYLDVRYLDENPTAEHVRGKKAGSRARYEAWRDRHRGGREGPEAGAEGAPDKRVSQRVGRAPSTTLTAPSAAPQTPPSAAPQTRLPTTSNHSNSAVGSATNAAIPFSPLSDLTHTGRAHTSAGEAPPSDPDAAALYAELKRHPCLADVATPAVAAQLAGNAQTAGKRLADVLRAVGETAREAGMLKAGERPLATEPLLSLLGRYCAKAKPEPPTPTGGPRRANGSPSPFVPPDPPLHRAPR
jgi:hypothetical protein